MSSVHRNSLDKRTAKQQEEQQIEVTAAPRIQLPNKSAASASVKGLASTKNSSSAKSVTPAKNVAVVDFTDQQGKNHKTWCVQVDKTKRSGLSPDSIFNRRSQPQSNSATKQMTTSLRKINISRTPLHSSSTTTSLNSSSSSVPHASAPTSAVPKSASLRSSHTATATTVAAAAAAARPATATKTPVAAHPQPQLQPSNQSQSQSQSQTQPQPQPQVSAPVAAPSDTPIATAHRVTAGDIVAVTMTPTDSPAGTHRANAVASPINGVGTLPVGTSLASPRDGGLAPPPHASANARRSMHRNSIAMHVDHERKHKQSLQHYMNARANAGSGQLSNSDSTTCPAQAPTCIFLPRGGTWVSTPAGPLQFGMPPETIKDSMKLGLMLPVNYVVPKERFNLELGINVAEFEFPAYYNFFLKRRKINLITNREVEPLIRQIFQETLLGPKSVVPPPEYSEKVPQSAYPDLIKEMSFFGVNPFDRTPLTVDTLISFSYFDEESGICELSDGVWVHDEGDDYRVTVQDDSEMTGRRELCKLPCDVLLAPPKQEPNEMNQHFVPPYFGITMLGNSDGFDATGTTTGFVLWLNRRGIMVDPPPHSGALLKRHGISPRLMRGIILTHCLSDDTRVLTQDGFLFRHEIASRWRQVKFACYNATTGELEYRHATAFIDRENESQQMIEFTSQQQQHRWKSDTTSVENDYEFDSDASSPPQSSNHVSLLVTPEHDMFVQRGNTPLSKVQARHLVEAKDATRSIRLLANARGGRQIETSMNHRSSASSSADHRWRVTQQVLPHVVDLGLDSAQKFDAFLSILGFWLGCAGTIEAQSVRFHIAHRNSKAEISLRSALDSIEIQQSEIQSSETPGGVNDLGVANSKLHSFFANEFASDSASIAAHTLENSNAISSQSSSSINQNSKSTIHQAVVDQLENESRISTDDEVEEDSLNRKSQDAQNSDSESELNFASESEFEANCNSNTSEYQDCDSRRPHRPSGPGRPASNCKSNQVVASSRPLPEWTLHHLDRDQMRCVIRGFSLAQGSTSKSLLTSDWRVRDQLVVACLHAGYAAHFVCKHRRADGIQVEQQLWSVRYADSDDSSDSSVEQSTRPTLCPATDVRPTSTYKGRVWCVTVPTGLIVVQRAHRNKCGIVTRASRPVVIGNCHADHDAGTFQKILEEGKVQVMTTQVILKSFLTKYSAISGLEQEFLQKLFVARPVIPGQRVAVYGGHIEFFYSLHSIPCVGFSAHCNGKSMIYSGDSFNDPAGIQKLFEQGLMSSERKEQLIHFPWHHDLILHEAGVPPIHTPMSTLEALPADVKARLYIVHKNPKDVPAERGLKSALVGPKNTITIHSVQPPNSSALELLDLLSSIELFSQFVLSRALDLIQCGTFLTFAPGDALIQEGTFGSTLYIIAMGTVSISQKGVHLKHMSVGDHFGEMSIVTGEARTATIRADTPVEVIQYSASDFRYIVRQTNAIERLTQLGIMQRSKSWQVIQANSILAQLSTSQKTNLQSIMQRRTCEKGEEVWKMGDKATEAVLISEGSFVFSRAADVQPFKTGAFIGEVKSLLADMPLSTTLVCTEAGALYYVNRAELMQFFDSNPGVQIQFKSRRFVE